MPVGTIKVTEYTQTGLLEAFVLANSQLDLANIRLGSIREFIIEAKKREERMNVK